MVPKDYGRFAETAFHFRFVGDGRHSGAVFRKPLYSDGYKFSRFSRTTSMNPGSENRCFEASQPVTACKVLNP